MELGKNIGSPMSMDKKKSIMSLLVKITVCKLYFPLPSPLATIITTAKVNGQIASPISEGQDMK